MLNAYIIIAHANPNFPLTSIDRLVAEQENPPTVDWQLHQTSVEAAASAAVSVLLRYQLTACYRKPPRRR